MLGGDLSQRQSSPSRPEPAVELQDVLALKALAEEAVREAARVLVVQEDE